MTGELSLTADGAAHHSGVLSSAELAAIEQLSQRFTRAAPGLRLSDQEELATLLAPEAALPRLARAAIGNGARPVRAILFDKTAANNWPLGWHQDRTIVVRERVECPGFGPWSKKDGLQHVEPPEGVLARMVTLRAHLDACGADNAPLLIARGSHKLGRVPVSGVPGAVASCPQAMCLAASGDVWIYATLILHASDAAARPARRRVLQMDFSADELPPGLAWLGVG